MARRRREFPVKIPKYIQDDVRVRADRSKGAIWVMRSEYERRQAGRLVEAGIVFEYEAEAINYFSSVHNGICFDCLRDNVGSGRVYTPDFYFPETGIFVETKGKFDSQNRTKMKDIGDWSEADVRMVFMRDNWLTKKKSMSYSRWCTLNNVPYAVGDIPLEWGKK